jgi:hypothetical protein
MPSKLRLSSTIALSYHVYRRANGSLSSGSVPVAAAYEYDNL